jgi:molybdopterin/thiamine biosynthesis adenylyltransferase
VSNVCPRIRTANVLLVSIRALANEVAKNLVLAGIASITLADHEVVTEDDVGAQFLITEADIGKNVSYSQLYKTAFLTQHSALRQQLHKSENSTPGSRSMSSRGTYEQRRTPLFSPHTTSS